MPRTRRDLVAFACASLAFAGAASAANLALPSVNPNLRTVGTTTFGNVGAMSNLNNGSNASSTGAAIFQVPDSAVAGIPPGSRGFGYDLGGIAMVRSLSLNQFVGESPLGPRARLNEVVVHTGGGNFPFSLPDQDNVELTLPSPVSTAWVMIDPISQHGGGDPQIGIGELAVNSDAASVGPRRTNVALGKSVTLQGGGWNNVNGNLTDNVLASANTDLSTSAFNNALTTAGNSIDIDLGSAFTLSGLGLAENDYGGAGGRQLVEGLRLEFSDDPAFNTVNATRDLSLQNIPYQQADFDPATGRYVRLSVLSQFPNEDANLGFTEVQLFQVPEPSALGLLAIALPPLLGRRRRS